MLPLFQQVPMVLILDMSELVKKGGGFLGTHSLWSYEALEVLGMLETPKRENSG